MTTYVVGDIQACYKGLKKLLKKGKFDPERDTLIAVGDLIGRGPQAEQTLAFMLSLGERGKTVLGNHDLHFLAICAGVRQAKPSDKFSELLASERLPKYVDWLRAQPLAAKLNSDTLIVHAGLYPSWSIQQAIEYSREVSEQLKANSWQDWISTMYGNQPSSWSEQLDPQSRTRFIVNAMTRMRFIEHKNVLNFCCKSSPTDAPPSLKPWFEVDNSSLTRQQKVIFGHWAALKGKTNSEQFIGLDTGYLWGNAMTLLNTETMQTLCVKHPEKIT